MAHHTDSRNLVQRVDEILTHALAEILLVLGRAHVHEGLHGESARPRIAAAMTLQSLQLVHHQLHRRWPVALILAQAGVDETVDLQWDIAAKITEMGRLFLEDHTHPALHRNIPERCGPRQHLEQHDPERVDIRRTARGPAAEGLGSQVVQCPRNARKLRKGVEGDLRVLRFWNDAGQAEVEDLDPAIRSHRDVRRFEIAMDDPVGVSDRHSPGELSGDLDGLTCIEPAGRDPVAQRGTVHVLEDQAPLAVQLLHAEQRRHIRVVDLGHRPGLALHDLQSLGAAVDLA